MQGFWEYFSVSSTFLFYGMDSITNILRYFLVFGWLPHQYTEPLACSSSFLLLRSSHVESMDLLIIWILFFNCFLQLSIEFPSCVVIVIHYIMSDRLQLFVYSSFGFYVIHSLSLSSEFRISYTVVCQISYHSDSHGRFTYVINLLDSRYTIVYILHYFFWISLASLSPFRLNKSDNFSIPSIQINAL